MALAFSPQRATADPSPDRALDRGRQVGHDRPGDVAVRAAGVLGLGVAGVDLIRSARGPLVLEVNAANR